MQFCIRGAFLIAALSGSALQAQSAALDAATAAMGGHARVLAMRTLVLEGSGTSLQFGQNHTPLATTQWAVTSFRRVYDFANRRWLHDQVREPRFTAANMAPQRVRVGLDGYPDGVAYNVTPADVMVRAPAQAAADRMNEVVLHPIGFVHLAAAGGAQTADVAAPPGQRRVRLGFAGGEWSMLIDSASSLPVRVERMVYQPMLGDVQLQMEFSDWRDVDGIRLPMRMVQRYDALFTTNEYQLSGARVNADPGNLAATDSVRALEPPAGLPPVPNVVVDSVAPGVWLLAGQSHHTVAIEQSGGVLLVEAPQNDTRTLAAIESARRLRPDRPLTALVNTHHHFDHAGGVRAAIAEGLTIVTHAGNRDFYERVVFPRRHSLRPDRLAQQPRPLRLIAVTDRYMRADSVRPVEVYSVPSDHSGSMLVVYLPNERILIQGDLYNPPAPTAVNPVFPFARALVDAVQQRGLAVDRVVGIHGRPVPWSEVVAAAQR